MCYLLSSQPFWSLTFCLAHNAANHCYVGISPKRRPDFCPAPGGTPFWRPSEICICETCYRSNNATNRISARATRHRAAPCNRPGITTHGRVHRDRSERAATKKPRSFRNAIFYINIRYLFRRCPIYKAAPTATQAIIQTSDNRDG